MYRTSLKNNKGVILVFALWALGMLSLLAVQISLNARQKVRLLSRLEKRSQLNLVVDGAVKKGLAILKADIGSAPLGYTGLNKLARHNNPRLFSRIDIGFGTAEVSYLYVEKPGDEPVKRFGVVDEKSKLNVNKASFQELSRLFEEVLSYNEHDAESLAAAMVDWREAGKVEIPGFFSEIYYNDYKNPYKAKRGYFEVLDELLLVKGVDRMTYQKLINYVTIYGDGCVNINTASWPVLLSLGLSNQLVDKILTVRRGEDLKDDTRDDFIFTATYDIASHIAQFYTITNSERGAIDNLNFQSKFCIDSDLYAITGRGRLINDKQLKTISSVYNTTTKKTIYWRET